MHAMHVNGSATVPRVANAQRRGFLFITCANESDDERGDGAPFAFPPLVKHT